MTRRFLSLLAITCWAGVLLAALLVAGGEARTAVVGLILAFGCGWLPLTISAERFDWPTYSTWGTAFALGAAVIVGIYQIDHDSDLTATAAFLEGFVLAGAAGVVGVVVGLAVMAVRRRIEQG